MSKILIADEHAVVRAGMRSIIEAFPQWSIVAEAADGKDAVAKAIATKPDLAILDYSLPLLNGIEATRLIRRCVPNIEILIFTMHDNESLLRELATAGARGYVRKSDPQECLISAIRSLGNHKPCFPDGASRILHKASSAKQGRASQTLTGREKSIVCLVAEGRSSKQIAAILDISVKTVETHRASIRQKLGFISTAGLIRYAIRNNMVQA